MIFSIILACQPETIVVRESSVPSVKPVAPVVHYEELPWPMEGVVANGLQPLSDCLDKVPSCSCIQGSDQQSCFPQFLAEIKTLPHLMRESMMDVTWSEDCPVSMDDLRLVRVLHWTETGQVQWGELIVTQRVSDNVRRVFESLYQQRFPIHSLKLAYQYDGSDEESMADNNTSAFNCRKVRGTNNWSEHSYGEALDINPLWNPWVKGAKVLPKNATRFVDRTMVVPGMINDGDAIIEVLRGEGWQWGSQKNGIRDYQHFSRVDHDETYSN